MWMANCYYKHRHAEPISEDNTFYVTGGTCSEMQISVERLKIIYNIYSHVNIRETQHTFLKL